MNETVFCDNCEATGQTDTGRMCSRCQGTGITQWEDPANA